MLGMALIVGCGPAAPPPEGIAPDPSTNPVGQSELKSMIDQIVQTGEAGSAASALRPSIEALSATDPAKGKALLADLEKLEAAGSPDQIRAIARKMADKL